MNLSVHDIMILWFCYPYLISAEYVVNERIESNKMLYIHSIVNLTKSKVCFLVSDNVFSQIFCKRDFLYKIL